ncbi:MAG: helix-turn-helix domain-containing protein [Acidaminobacter sp.]|uniref:helix-turn-helix domain-containing protein n=1 Tax=Acidaminobacter sp. TaxID=1872102 RepID=UPI001384990B|nr:helix-turn-helix transcriptional regulator [Acidaminobacter sp.]MZQ98912.1 helix-turn-helix domain-containing protein [Acidaminobacter sp.]
MDHNKIKKILFNDDELKNEYNELSPIYELKKEIIRLRLEKGLSQRDLADLIGTKQSAISRLENGSYNPTVEFLNRVAHSLGKELHITFN